MYLNLVNSFEIGKQSNSIWLHQSRDMFMSILLAVCVVMFSFFGTYFLFVAKDASISYSLYGFAVLSAGIYAFAKYKKYYPTFLFYVFLLMHTALVIGFLCHDNLYISLIFSIIFPFYTITFIPSRHAIIATITFTVIYLAAYILLSPANYFSEPYNTFIVCSAMLIAVGIFFRISISQVLTDKITLSKDNKIIDSEKELQAKNEYISQLSYQIRTPLNNIIGVGNMLNDTNLNERQKDWMETILASANNLVDVMNLIASKVSSKKIEIKSANIAFNLQDLLKNTVQLFVGQSEEYNIALKPNLTNTFDNLSGDPIRFKQILLTLIDAIIKNKTSEKINIILSYIVEHETEHSINITFSVKVSDIMNLSQDKDVLNYSIAAGLVELLGGKLIEMKGETFTSYSFSLRLEKVIEQEKNVGKQEETKPVEPVNPMAASAQVTATTTEVKPTAPAPVDLKNANILLVEDNLINQKIVILSIQKLVKNIDIANNGQEAVDKYTSTAKYDIVLMDIQMPIMDGLQATKRIREIEDENKITPIPIIAITANALAGDREHCLASGMNEYISKPFQVEVLVGKMKTLLHLGSSE